MTSIFVTDVRGPADGWGWTFTYGASLVLFGIFALAWPFASALAIGIFLGWALVAAGIFGIASGLRGRRLRGHGRDLAVGALSILLGLLLLVSPLLGALTILYAMSFWFAVAGVTGIATGLRQRRERASLIVPGVIDLGFSLILLSGFAHGQIGLVAVFAGLSFIASGAVTMVAALQMRAFARAR